MLLVLLVFNNAYRFGVVAWVGALCLGASMHDATVAAGVAAATLGGLMTYEGMKQC